jgi:hypothetical protein
VTARRRWLGRGIGWLAVALSLGFIGTRISRDLAWNLILQHLQPLALAVAVGALIYGLAGLLLAEAWRQLLATEPTGRPASRYHAVYGRTQIAKYLPGNVFHFAGRQWLGRALGHSQAVLALASVTETALLVAVAGALALPLAADHLGGLPDLVVLAVVLGLLTALLVPRLRQWLPATPRLTRAALLYGAFFLVAGGVLWLLALSLDAAGQLGLWTAVSAFALCWIAGFATPGAAAGIGVREAVLIMVLDDRLGPEISLAVALALRLATACGDVLFFALAMILRSQPAPAAARLASRPRCWIGGCEG